LTFHEYLRQRRSSDGDSKSADTPVKKSAWKQLDWSAETEAATAVGQLSTVAAEQQTSAALPVANPWSRRPAVAAAPQLSPVGQLNRSFAEIMAEDAKVSRYLFHGHVALIQCVLID
jgi:hypothetical protein